MMAPHRLPRPVVAVAVVLFAVALSVPLTGAKGGNGHGSEGGVSEAAHACQKGGWESLAPEEDPTAAFTSTGKCVSYVATGGTVVAAESEPIDAAEPEEVVEIVEPEESEEPAEPRDEAQAHCEDVANGEFTAEPGVSADNSEVAWDCETDGYDAADDEVLLSICQADTGALRWQSYDTGGSWLYRCWM